jgi:hypothetical protein
VLLERRSRRLVLPTDAFATGSGHIEEVRGTQGFLNHNKA